MKGGRTAPRNVESFSGFAFAAIASMKGGRTAPRNHTSLGDIVGNLPSFNEGGADCPPKLRA